MTELRALVAAVLLFVAGGIVGLFSRPSEPLPVKLSRDTSEWVRTPLEGTWTIVLAIFEHPKPALFLLALVAVPYVLVTLASLIPRRIHKDPQRAFTKSQRSAAADLASNRCEMESIWYLRCRRYGSHGDHWLPHSKGGASSMENLVWACSVHNLAKGARLPTWGQTMRLELRRRRYFPPGSPTRPGARYARR